MKTIDLNGTWRMKSVSGKEWIDANVPGTVFGALHDAGMVEDPYYRDNEEKVTRIFDADYEYSREFSVGRDVLAHDQVILCCEGLDTIAVISVNGRKLADTDNMHRTYRFNVKNMLAEGKNTIDILFRSPVVFTKEMAPIIADWWDLHEAQDGRLMVKTTLPDNYQTYGFLLSFGNQVEVISPPHIRKALAQIAKDIYRKYCQEHDI